MFETQFYIRLILNIIIGNMFAYALYKMAKHNNQETVKKSHTIMHIFGWIFVGLSLLSLVICIYTLTIVDFPSQLIGPFISSNEIIRPSSAIFYWGYPTNIQSSALNMAMSTFDSLGFGAYFLYFKSSNSKWWKKILKFIVVLLLYAFMASATNFHYFDIFEFIVPILFIILWLIIVNRKDKPIKTNENDINETSSNTFENNSDISNMDTLTDSNGDDDTFANSLKEDNNVTEEDCSNETNSVLDIDTNLEDKTDIAQFCRHCGKKIEPDSKFCKYCGGRLDYNEKKLTFYIFISKIVNFIKSIFSACFKFIKLKSPNMKKLKKVLKVFIITLISILAIIGVVFGICYSLIYYFDEVVPNNKAEEILLSETASLNRLQGDSLFTKCNDIIWNDNIPHLDDDSKYREDVYRELSELAWQKVEKFAYDGKSKAQYMLGLMYYGYDFYSYKFNWEQNGYGHFINKNINFDKAAYWFLKAAEQNNRAAQYYIGRCYRYGTGVEKNMEKAIYWFKLSATNGDDYGQLNYGDCFRDGCIKYIGEGYWTMEKNSYYSYQTWNSEKYRSQEFKIIIEQNIDSAKYYWEKSAAQGNMQAIERLEKIYEKISIE